MKFQFGKLSFAVPIERVLSEILNGVTWPVLSVLPAHIMAPLELPAIHRDPFDRLPIAQALAESMTLATADERIHGYKIATIW